MSLSTPSPNSLLSRLDAAGNPYHGLFEDGALTLPNSETMAHPTPAGVWYMSGRSIRVQRPGWTAPVRTEDQQAADTAAGYQWLGYGIMAGEGALFYGQEVGNGKWIYIDPAGVRWLVEYIIPGGESLGTLSGSNMTVRLSRFGEFGADPEAHDYSVAVPDLGQTTPDWSGFGTAAQMGNRLIDVKSDGSAALIMGYRDMGSEAGYFRDAALAFVEITLSGAGGAATVAMLLRRNRAQCVGTVMQDPWPSSAGSTTLNAVSRGVVDAPLVGVYAIGTNSQDFNNYDFDDCTGGSRHVGSLSLVKSVHWSDGYIPSVPDSFPRAVFYEYSADIEASRTGIIASMFYGSDGTLKEITADIEMNWVISNPSVTATSGPTVARETAASGTPGACSNVITLHEMASVTLSQSSSVSSAITITLRSDGVVCYQKTFSGSESGTYTEVIDYRAAAGPDFTFPVTRGTRTSVLTRTYNDQTVEIRNVTQQSSSWPVFSFELPSYSDSIGSIPGIYPWTLRRAFENTNDGTGTVRTTEDLQMYEIFGNQSRDYVSWPGEPALSDGNNATFFVQLVRMGPSTVGVLESLLTDASPNFVATFSGQMATSGGAVSLADVVAPTMILAANPYPQSPLRASYHPVTGEIARSFNAVCWV